MRVSYLKRNGFSLSVITALFFLCCDTTAAQENQPKPQPELSSKTDKYYRQKLEAEITEERKEEEALPWEIDAYARYMPSASVEAMPGKVGLIDTATEYSYEFKAFGKLPVEFSLEQQYISIDDSVGVTLPTHLIGFSTGIETTLPFLSFRNIYLRLGISPSYYSDDWSFHSSAFRLPVHSFFIYQPDDKWTFVAGVAVAPDFQNPVWPIAGFIYKPNERLTFNIIPERPTVTYALNDKLTIFGEGDISYSEFEVNKDSLRGAVLQYQETNLGGGLEYQFNKFIRASASAGGVFNRQLKYTDSQGKVNIKNGLYTEFRIEARI